MIDASYNRYAFNDDNSLLPDWFKEDEAKHNKPELPITKWQVEQPESESEMRRERCRDSERESAIESARSRDSEQGCV